MSRDSIDRDISKHAVYVQQSCIILNIDLGSPIDDLKGRQNAKYYIKILLPGDTFVPAKIAMRPQQ